MAKHNTNQNRNKPSEKKTHDTTINSKKNIQGNPTDTHILYLIPIMFVVAVLPLITKIHQYSTNYAQFKWFPVDDIFFDFFLYYKQRFLIITALIMSLFLLHRYITDKKNIRIPKIFIPLFIYALLALLSSVFSTYRSFSFTGTMDQFESIFALLSYCIVTYYSYLIVRSERDVKTIIYALLIGVLIMCLLGLSQFIGHDFFDTNAGWSLISNSTYANNKADFPITAGFKRVYLSLFNPNYVGVYVSLLFPVMFYLTIFTRNILLRLAFLLASIGLLVCLYGSLSTTGFVSVIITVILSVLLLWRYLFKYYYISIPFTIVMIIGLLIINSYADNYIGRQINKLTNIHKTSHLLTEIQTNEDNLVIHYGDNTLKVEFSVYENEICTFIFKDQANNDVPYRMDEINGPATINDDRFAGFEFTPVLNNDGVIMFKAVLDNQLWYFTNQYGDRTYYYVNLYGKYDKIVLAPSSIFTGYETFASGRGYIWSRSIPLLKNRLFLGSGADTFSLVFPQNDYLNSKTYGYEGQVMSKPHNLYLQIGVQTGVLSLLAFLLFYGWYFVTSIPIYIKCKFDNYYSIIGAAIFTGSIGYMISGISNDSSITTAPIFWVLIGVGIAMNQLNRRDSKKANV